MMKQPVIVIGASENRRRYSYKATKLLVEHAYTVFLVGNKTGSIFNQTIYTLEQAVNQALNPQVVTLYVGPKHQLLYAQQIVRWKPKYVIFNPGTEKNVDFENFLIKNDIEPLQACTLVMLKNGLFKTLTT